MIEQQLRRLIDTGQFARAAEVADSLLNQHPQDPAIWEMRGYIALHAGDSDTAIRSLERAVELQPENPRWISALGTALAALGRLRDAETVLHRAFRLAPKDTGLMLRLAQTLMDLQKLDEAAMLARRLVALDPVQPAAWRLLGQVAISKSDAAAALRAYERASTQAPDDARMQSELAQACMLNGDLRRAHAALTRAYQIDPRLRPALIELLRVKQLLAAWNGMTELAQALCEMVELGLPLPGTQVPGVLMALGASAELQRKAAQLTAATQARSLAHITRVMARKPPQHGGLNLLRIGVLSELQDDASTRGWIEVVEQLRTMAVEVTVFACGSGESGALRKRVQAVWPVVELADWPLPRAAQRIADAGLHVLLDASGGSTGVRSALPILRPCARQLIWPGLAHSSGGDWYDGYIADATLAGRASATALLEPVLALDCSAVSLDTRIEPVHGLDRAAAGLPDTGFVYAHLGGPVYYHPALFDVWARILLRAPGSVLWLAAGVDSAWTQPLLRDEMLLRGVPANRLVFCMDDAPDLQLARLALVDLVLDSWPLSARAQAALAAQAAVPVLTLPGETPASRSAASLNAHMELDDLNCSGIQQYIDTAIAIASNPDAAEVLRATLQSRRGPASVLDMRHTAECLYRVLRRLVD